MNEFQTSRVWFMWFCFSALALTIFIIQLLPISTRPSAWTMPDILMGFAFAWSVRRPDYVPLLLLAVLLLLGDLLLQRPPGLWAVLVLLGCESLKNRSYTLRVASFTVEWATVSMIALGAMLFSRMVMTVLFVPQPSLGLHLIQIASTILCYPLIVFLTHYVMGVRKAVPGAFETSRGRQ